MPTNETYTAVGSDEEHHHEPYRDESLSDSHDDELVIEEMLPSPTSKEKDFWSKEVELSPMITWAMSGDKPSSFVSWLAEGDELDGEDGSVSRKSTMQRLKTTRAKFFMFVVIGSLFIALLTMERSGSALDKAEKNVNALDEEEEKEFDGFMNDEEDGDDDTSKNLMGNKGAGDEDTKKEKNIDEDDLTCPMLWNKFENKANVLMSEIGPGFTLASWKIPHFTESKIKPSHFGNGLLVNPIPDKDPGSDGANFFALDLYEIGLTPQQGTIEFWFDPGVDSSVHAHTFLLTTSDYLTNHFCGAETDDAPDGVCDPVENICCFATGSDSCCEPGNAYQIPPRPTDKLEFNLAWAGLEGSKHFDATFIGGEHEVWRARTEEQTFSKGDAFHLAVVWDSDGIDGTEDTLRIYKDGEVAGSELGSLGGGESPFLQYLYLGTNPNSGPYDTFYNAMVGTFDNLKIWEFAKTDFSDRDDEDSTIDCPQPFQPFFNSNDNIITAEPPANEPKNPEVCPLFWNRFESEENVENSDIGVGFICTSWKMDDYAESKIEPSYFGNGLVVNPMEHHSTGTDGANFFALDLPEVGLTTEQGTIEFWFTPDVDSKINERLYLFKTSEYLTNHFCGAGGDDAPEGVCDYLTNTCCFKTESENCCVAGGSGQMPKDPYPKVEFNLVWLGKGRKHFEATFQNGEKDAWRVRTEPHNFGKGESFHLAVVWDAAGIDGTDDSIRVYLNGEVAGAESGSWGGGAHPFLTYLYLGTSPNSGGFGTFYNAMPGSFDNLKMWEFAKVDFSDRLQEDTSAGCEDTWP